MAYRRHADNLNNKFQLNPKPMYDFMEKHGLTFEQMAKKVGCHEHSIYNACKKRRIPRMDMFLKWQEITGVPEAAWLAPLVPGAA